LDLVFESKGFTGKSFRNNDLQVFRWFLVGWTPFGAPQFVKPWSGNRKMSKSGLPASGDGLALRRHDLGMILAWHENVVSNMCHRADVMKKGVPHSSQKQA
jgi:hypothetical protein